MYFVAGVDDFEGTLFAVCTTYEKAEKAKDILESKECGYKDYIIIISNISVDTIEVDRKIIEL